MGCTVWWFSFSFDGDLEVKGVPKVAGGDGPAGAFMGGFDGDTVERGIIGHAKLSGEEEAALREPAVEVDHLAGSGAFPFRYRSNRSAVAALISRRFICCTICASARVRRYCGGFGGQSPTFINFPLRLGLPSPTRNIPCCLARFTADGHHVRILSLLVG